MCRMIQIQIVSVAEARRFSTQSCKSKIIKLSFVIPETCRGFYIRHQQPKYEFHLVGLID
jgi:hypothetical protein